MSLRLRLILLPILVIVTGMALLAFLQIGAAQQRILVETRASAQVARTLIQSAIQRRRNLPPELAPAGLAEEIPPVRHVLVSVGPVEGPEPKPPARVQGVPGWFADLVAPERAVQRFRIVAQGNKTAGEVVVVANPADELQEIWDDWRELTVVLAMLSAVVSATLVAVVSKGLEPLRALGDALDRLGEGDLNVVLGPLGAPELQRVGRRFNRLVASLNRATEDNRLLIGRLMSLQEDERKAIAHELHDEFGPSLFGIRAELSSIAKLARAEPPRVAEIEDRLASIGGQVEQIQRINSRLLEELRPLVLDEMGLSAALSRLVQAWAERHPDMNWRRKVGKVGEVPEPLALALYRAVQECLTNVVRHSGAEAVEVTLQRTRGEIRVCVRDDGRGFSDDARFGFGLLGMAERARALGGRLEVSRPPEGGALVQLIHPLEEGR